MIQNSIWVYRTDISWLTIDREKCKIKKRKISEEQNIKKMGYDQARGRTRVNIQRWKHLSMDERTSSTAQPSKDWASYLPCHSNSGLHDSVTVGSSTITPSASVRNLGVIFDNQLTFKEHIAKTVRSCRFALHNIRKIRPSQREYAAQLIVQALVISRLDYCNALLAGLPSNTTKPLQMIQNAAAGLQRAQKSPCYTSLYLLALATSCSSYQVQDTDACI